MTISSDSFKQIDTRANLTRKMMNKKLRAGLEAKQETEQGTKSGPRDKEPNKELNNELKTNLSDRTVCHWHMNSYEFLKIASCAMICSAWPSRARI